MPLEAAIYISQLDPAKPNGATDDIAEGDDTLRLLKTVLQTQFSGLGPAAVTATAAQINDVVNKAPEMSPALKGIPTAPTAAVGTSTSQLATTAFVQATVTASSSPSTMILELVSKPAETAVSNIHYVLINGSASTLALPASPAVGTMVWVTPGNGLNNNVIARNGSNIMSLAEDMTLDNADATAALRYINSSLGWRLL